MSLPLATPPLRDAGAPAAVGGEADGGGALGGDIEMRSLWEKKSCAGTTGFGGADIAANGSLGGGADCPDGALSSESKSTIGADDAVVAFIVGAPRGGGVNATGAEECCFDAEAPPKSASAS